MAKFETIMTDPSSGEQAHIKSNDYFLFQQKKEKQLEKWKVKNTKMQGQEKATSLTEEAKKEQERYGQILADTLMVDDKIKWEDLKDKTLFHHYKPAACDPQSWYFKDVPSESWIERYIPYFLKRRLEKQALAQAKYDSYIKNYEIEEASLRSKYEDERAKFESSQNEHNSKISTLQNAYETGDKQAIQTYVNMVLENSNYPDTISLEYSLEYVPGSMVMRLEIQIPHVDALNLISEVKYLASKDEHQIKMLPKNEVKNYYTNVTNQIVLRTLHEIFESEYVGHIQRVEVSAVVNGIDSKTGKDTALKFMEVGAERKAFNEINLKRVDHQACLESLGCKFAKDTSSIKMNKAA